MENTFNKIALIFVSISIIGFWILKHETKSIVDITEDNPKYFLVIYGDNWLKISKSKKDIFFNKIYSTCPESVVVPISEKVKVLKPKAWKNFNKKHNITNGLEIEIYTDGKIKYNQMEIDSLSIKAIQNCGK